MMFSGHFLKRFVLSAPLVVALLMVFDKLEYIWKYVP